MNMEMHTTPQKTKESFQKALSFSVTPCIPETLALQTIYKIKLQAKRTLMVRLISWSLVWAVALAITSYGAVSIYGELQTSLLGEYLSLIWTDTYTISTALFQNFLLVLVDTLPLFGGTVFLIGITLCIQSIKKTLSLIRDTQFAI